MSSPELISLCSFDDAHQLGELRKISKAGVEVGLFSRTPKEQSTQGAGEYGEFVVVGSRRRAYFAQVVEAQFCEQEASTPTVSKRHYARSAKVKLLATLDFESNRVISGLESFPKLGEGIFAATPELVQAIAEGVFSKAGASNEVTLDIARLSGAGRLPLSVTPERLFGRHCAVLGTTGGGKSWTVARLMEECARYSCKVILFDATGEYNQLAQGVRHVHFGHDRDNQKGSQEIALPYYHLTENDLFAIFEPSGESQGPKLRAAMKTLKLARVCPEVAPSGVILKAHRSKVEYLEEYERHLADIEHPLALFDISKLCAQIENECVNPQSSPVEPLVWGGPNTSDQSNCMPLIGKINDIINSPGLASVFAPGDSVSLIDEIFSFIKNPDQRVLCVSLRHLSFAHNVREIITNAIARTLLELARSNRFRDAPLLLVLDEAHQFLSSELESKIVGFSSSAFGLIAKEGRKYGLTLCLATQRPRDIPEGILSQMGTLIIHRLINDLDRSIVERACGELDSGAAAMIPALAPGEAILLGVDFPVPLMIKIEAATAKPSISGGNFQEHWRVKTRVRVNKL
jgi:DNA helicase HerA-like ATPase